MRAGSLSCLVRLRAYGEARLAQVAINDGHVEGVAVPLGRWDRANGWSASHAHNAMKIHRAWLAEGRKYPVSWADLSVREVVARLVDRRKPAVNTVRGVLAQWLRVNESAQKHPEHIVLQAGPRAPDFVRRAVQAVVDHDPQQGVALIRELRQLLDQLERAALPTPNDTADNAPPAAPLASVAQPPSTSQDLPNFAHTGRVPKGLVYLNAIASINRSREQFRRSPNEWRPRSGSEPVATYRRSTPLWSVDDLEPRGVALVEA